MAAILSRFTDSMSEPVFLGYVVHLPDTGEFLAKMNVIGNNAGGWLWSIDPELAVRYSSFNAARQITDIYSSGAVVKMLWKSGDQFLLTDWE